MNLNGGSVSGAGTLKDQGTLGINSAQTLANPFVVQGTVTGNSPLSITGAMTTNGGSFSGPGWVTVQGGATWNTPASGSISVNGGSLINDGTATIGASGSLYVTSGVTVTNNGTMTMEAGSEIYGYNTTSVFANPGTLVVSPGSTGTATLGNTNYLVVNNTGSIQITSGTLEVLGATLNLNGGSVSGAGTLKDQGTLGINSAQTLANPLVVQGTVTLGPSASLSASSLTSGPSGLLELSAGNALQFGHIAVSGSLSISNLYLELNASYTPSCGTSVTALTAGTLSGSWAGVGGSPLPNGGNWAATTTATSAGAVVNCSPPQSAPVVSGVSPTSGPMAGNTSVTITGSGFEGSTAVDFGTTGAQSFVVNSDSQITAVSPTEPAGTVDLTVVSPGGTSATSVADEFTYEPGPVVTSVNPPSGSPAGGTSVTIDGSGFTGATAVKFGSAAAPSFTVNTDSQITATTPAGAAGQVDVTVSTPGGTSATGPSDVYTFSTVTGCTETWTGATDSQWSTASNWSNGNVPSFGDEVCIPAGASNLPVELSSSASIKTLNNQGSLDVGGSLTISGSGSVSSGALTAEGTIAGNGSLSVTGTMTTNGATFGGPGAVTVQSGSTWEIASTTVSGGSVVNDGTAAIDSTDALNLGCRGHGDQQRHHDHVRELADLRLQHDQRLRQRRDLGRQSGLDRDGHSRAIQQPGRQQHRFDPDRLGHPRRVWGPP